MTQFDNAINTEIGGCVIVMAAAYGADTQEEGDSTI